MILYFRSLMVELEISQDDHGALMKASAQQPTPTILIIMDIKHFAILQWVEQDILILHDIPTHDNCVAAFARPLGCQLFCYHFDTIMGRWIPKYALHNLGHHHLSSEALSVHSL